MQAPTPAARAPVLLLLLCALTPLLIYWPGLAGPFLFDDFPNLVTNRSIAQWLAGRDSLWSVLAAGHAGPLGRPLAVLSLALQAKFNGLHPWPFKLFNLLVHVANTVLVFLLARRLLARNETAPAHSRATQGWALMVALLWSVHPLALNPVLYVVQRMSSLSAFGMLLALYLQTLAYQRLQRGQGAAWLLWLGVPLAALFAALAKENALLLPAYLLVLAATLLRADALPARVARQWRWQVGLAGVLPLLLVLLTLPLAWSTLLQGFANRDFTLPQRLWTEARVVWMYLGLLVWPTLANLGLYHDDVVLSTGWLAPVTTLPAVLALGLLSVLAWVGRRRAPWWAFAWGFLLASQLLESTVVPLELMHEHRMYLGMLAPVLAFVHSARALLERLTAAAQAERVPLLDRLVRTGQPALLLLPLLLALAGLTLQRAITWRNPLVLMEVEANHHPGSLHAVYDLSTLYADLAERTPPGAEQQRLFRLAEQASRRALALAPDQEKPWVGLILLCSEAGCTPPADSFARLQALLRRASRADLMTADLRALVQCRVHGPCQLQTADLRASLLALALNRQLNALDRGVIVEQLQALDAFDAARKHVP